MLDTTEGIATFWALTRHTAATLACEAAATPTKPVAHSSDLVTNLERTARNRQRRRPAGCKPQRPLPLRVPLTDPRHLQYRDELAGDDIKAATAFLDEAATTCEWHVALNVGAARLFLHFPRLALASPALVAALVGYLTRDEVLRVRTRADASRVAREKRALAAVLLKLFAAEHRDDQTVFAPAVLTEAFDALVRPGSKPRHLRIAYQFLLLAPAHAVARHPLVGHVAASVARLRSAALATFAERLTRRIAHPDALDILADAHCALP